MSSAFFQKEEADYRDEIETFPKIRLRRLRQHAALRELISENRLSTKEIILPLFVRAGNAIKNPIHSMPGHYQWSVDQLDEEIAKINALKLPAVILFGIPDYKDVTGSAALQAEGVVQRAIKRING